MIKLYFVLRKADIPTLIGSHGSTVKELEKNTNTIIGVQRDDGTLERDFNRLQRIRIKGTKDNIVKALVEVTNTITPEKDAPYLQLHLLPFDEILSGHQRQKEFARKFEYVNEELSARCKVVCLNPARTLGIEIFSSEEKQFEEAVTRVLDFFLGEGIVGELKADRQVMIKLAKESIDEQVAQITSKEVVAFLIPYDKTRALIGVKGATIKKLESTHDVHLVVEAPTSAFCLVGRTVLLRGTIKNIGECLADVTTRIFEGDDINPRVLILLPPGVPRFLIGHKGVTIKQIEEESGCVLGVERAETRRHGEVAGREYDIDYCQISGEEHTIAKGTQGVVARILMQLDKQGETSEATIPEGAVFGHFVNTIVGMKVIRRKATREQRSRGRRESRRRRRSRSRSSGPRRGRPARHRGDSIYDYDIRDERFERPSRANDHKWRSTRPVMASPRRSPVRGMSCSRWFPDDVRFGRDYPPNPTIRDEVEGSGWLTSVVDTQDGSAYRSGQPGVGGYGVSKGWKEVRSSRDPWA